MMGLYVHVVYTGDWWGEDPLTETRHETPGDLFRALAGKDKRYPWEALGRCTGKVYVDIPDSPCSLCKRPRDEHEYSYPANPIEVESVAPGGTSRDGRTWPNGAVIPHGHYYQAEPRPVGWIFVARNPEPVNRGDTQPTGLREAWVTVHAEPPTVTRTPHYAELGR